MVNVHFNDVLSTSDTCRPLSRSSNDADRELGWQPCRLRIADWFDIDSWQMLFKIILIIDGLTRNCPQMKRQSTEDRWTKQVLDATTDHAN